MRSANLQATSLKKWYLTCKAIMRQEGRKYVGNAWRRKGRKRNASLGPLRVKVMED
jgi:hypothetical protein